VSGAIAAKVVSINAGETNPNINFNLSKEVTVKLSGRVIRESALVPNVQQVRLNNGIPAQVQSVTLAADGTFVFPAVRPGSYDLVAVPLNGVQPLEIVVGDKNLNVDLTIPLMVSITGAINVDGGGPQPQFSLEFTRSAGPAYHAVFISSANGSITGRLPIGEYQLSLGSLPSGYSLKSVESDSTDLKREHLTVSEAGMKPIIVGLGVSSPPPWVKLSGHLTGTGSLPGGATLVLSSLSGGISVESVLKNGGAFEFPMILPGTYRGRVTPAQANAAPPISIVVPEGHNDILNLEIAVPHTIEIKGHVGSEGNRPQRVMLMFNSALGLSDVLVPLDSSGNFTIQMPEGEQSIAVRLPQGYVLKAFTYGSVDLQSGSVTIPQVGAQLQVTLGLEKPSSGVKISGKLTNLPNRAVLSPRITIQPAVIAVQSEITVKPDGTFELSPVPPGNYRIVGALPGLGLRGSIMVNVGNLDLNGIEIPIPNLVVVRGHVTLDGDGPMPSVSLQLADSSGTNSYTVTPQRDGSFTLNLQEGEFSVSIAPRGLPPGYVISTMKYGDVDLLKEPLKTAATNSADLNIGYKSNAAVGSTFKVSGHASNGNAGMDLTLVGASSGGFGRGGFGGGLGQQTTTGTAGAFEFSNVLPGRYTLRGTVVHSLRVGNMTRFMVSLPLVVSNSDLRDVQLPIPAESNVSFQVSVEGRGPVPSLRFQLTNGSDQGSAQGVPNSGTFVLSMPASGWRISLTNLPAGYSVKSMTYGSTDLLREPLTLNDNATTEIQLTLSLAANSLHKVSGRVTGLGPSPTRVSISLVGASTAFTMNVPVDSDGNFEFADVAQGNYIARLPGRTPLLSIPVTVGNADVTGLIIDAH
jgi:hypothetical protein